MSRLDSLPADQRAVLQLVLQQGRTYEDLGGMLGIDAASVRTRARAATEALGPETGIRLSPDERADITDFLLGQQTVSEREATRAFLAGSAAARSWARGLAGELRELGGDALPAIPDADDVEAPTEAPAFEAEPERARRPEPGARRRFPSPQAPSAPGRAGAGRPRPSRESSRLGGALLLAGLGILLAVVIVLIARGGDDDDEPTPRGDTTTQAQGTTGGATGSTTAGNPRPEAQVNLRAAQEGSRAVGIAQIVNQGGVRAMALVGQDLEPSSRGYAVWLFNSQTEVTRLGFTQPVTRNGRLSALARLPENANRFRELVVSRETSRNPRQPSTIVLRGPLRLRR